MHAVVNTTVDEFEDVVDRDDDKDRSQGDSHSYWFDECELSVVEDLENIFMR